MSDVAIRVEGLSKRYRIGQYVGGGAYQYRALRDVLTGAMYAPFRRLRARGKQRAVASNLTADSHELSANFIWALKDVSFKVKQGQVVGIIGRNGAGKSTLLKLLSRITEPTEGQADIRGRIGSLLEVGTGFHPELTGRENIYLSGAILGMTKKEINWKFDEIVDFSGIEKFIDTPVKRYSSGMWVRLGFAVAAHLEPEILLVDEVLAVGDAAFQKKCLGKMGDVVKEGRTVLFVSHNMPAISSLCDRTILLQDGRIATQGPTPQVVAEYLSSGDSTSAEAVWSFEDAPSSEVVKLRAVRVLNEQGEVSFNTDITKPIDLEIEFWCLQRTKMTPAFHLYNQLGILLFMTANLHDQVWAQRQYEPGLYRCSCRIPANFLNEGTYFVNAYLSCDIRRPTDVRKEPAASFRSHDFGTSRGGCIAGRWPGLVRPLLPWAGSHIGDLL